MEQSISWELACSQLTKKFPAFYGTRSIHTCPPPVRIPSHIDPVHTPTSHFLKTQLNIIFHLRPRSPSVLFPSGLSTKTLHTSVLSAVWATCPVHLILPDLITRKIFGVEYRSLSSSLCSSLHSMAWIEHRVWKPGGGGFHIKGSCSHNFWRFSK